jgi:hypothetical protein
MARMTLKCRVDEPAQEVILQTEMEDKPLAHVRLDAPSVDQLIQDLGKHRATLRDEVPRQLDPGSRLQGIYDPAWRVPSDSHPAGRIIAFRHPGLGWLSFVLPENEAAAIADWLTKRPGEPGSPPA